MRQPTERDHTCLKRSGWHLMHGPRLGVDFNSQAWPEKVAVLNNTGHAGCETNTSITGTCLVLSKRTLRTNRTATRPQLGGAD